jgi:ribose transport system substrate-binding protein
MRRTIATLIALALSGIAAAPVGAAPTSSTRADATSLNIVLLTNDSFDPYYITVAAGAKAEAKALGANLSWVAPANPTVPLQTQVLNATIAKKPDFVLMSAVDAKAMVAPMKALKKAGIPVITIDSDVIDKSVRLGSITSDNEAGGRLAALVMSRLVGSGKVGYQGYTPGIQSVDQRHAGWLAGLKQHKGLVDAGSSYDNYDLKDIAAKASAMMQRNPDLKGIFSPATNEVIGTASAVQAAGKTGKVHVVGFDASPDEVLALRRGTVDALIVQKAYGMGKLGVDYAVRYLKSGTKVPAATKVGFVVATKANVGSPSISKFIYRAK